MSTQAFPSPRRLPSGRGRAALVWARGHGIVVALLGLCVVFALTSSAFLTSRNLENLAGQSATPALIACGMTVVILAGEFDLSVGAIFGFAGVAAAWLSNQSGSAIAIMGALAIGAGLGVINGTIVSRIRIQSFLTTLATQFVIVGAATFLTSGTNTFQVDNYPSFTQLANNTLLGVEYKAWIAIAAFVGVWLVLRHTTLGKQIFAVGGSRAAARVAGVRVQLVVTTVFVFSGTLAALAGSLAAADTGSGQADGGLGTELTAIAAVIIGGTSVAGGRGGVWRTLAGVMLLQVVSNGFTLLYVSPTYDTLVQGAIILGIIIFDSALKRRTA